MKKPRPEGPERGFFFLSALAARSSRRRVTSTRITRQQTKRRAIMNTQATTDGSNPTRPREPDRAPTAPTGTHPPGGDGPTEADLEELYDRLYGTPAIPDESAFDVFIRVVKWIRRRPSLWGTILAGGRVGRRLFYRDQESGIAPERGGQSA